MKKIKRWLMWKWYVMYLMIYNSHIENPHNADFQVCGHCLCWLVRPFDIWYVNGDNWFYYNREMHKKT